MAIQSGQTLVGKVGVAFSQTPAYTGDVFLWGVATGSVLPIGLSLDENGLISGNPSQKGSYAVTFQTWEELNNPVSVSVVIEIAEGAPFLASNQSFTSSLGLFQKRASLLDEINRPVNAWSATGMPGWASLNASTGIISGIAEPGNYVINITASGPGGSDSEQLIISIGDIPKISTLQSVLAWPAGQDFEFRFYATNQPTSWRVADGRFLPNGVLLDATNGKIFGAATNGGVWDLEIIATNSYGDSSPFLITIGIFDLPQEKDVSKIAQINTDTWAVTFSDPFPAITSSGGSGISLAAAHGGVRYGDLVTFRLKFIEPAAAGTGTSSGAAGGVEVFPLLISAKFGIKGLDTDPVFFETNDWDYSSPIIFDGTNYAKRHFINVSFENSSLLSFLGDYESDGGTYANCICEFELIFSRHSGGGEINKITTQPFVLRVHRDQIS